MANFLPKKTGFWRPFAVTGLSVLLIAGVAQAVTTLSANIDTDGDLTVDGDLSVGDVEGGTTFLTLEQDTDDITVYANNIEIEVGEIGPDPGTIDILGELGDEITIGSGDELVAISADVWQITALGDAEFDTLTLGTGDQISGHTTANPSILIPVSIAAGTCSEGTASVSDADDGDSVVVTPSSSAGALGSFTWGGYVSDTDEVTIRVCNPTGDAIMTPFPLTFRVDVWKHPSD